MWYENRAVTQEDANRFEEVTGKKLVNPQSYFSVYYDNQLVGMASIEIDSQKQVIALKDIVEFTEDGFAGVHMYEVAGQIGRENHIEKIEIYNTDGKKIKDGFSIFSTPPTDTPENLRQKKAIEKYNPIRYGIYALISLGLFVFGRYVDIDYIPDVDPMTMGFMCLILAAIGYVFYYKMEDKMCAVYEIIDYESHTKPIFVLMVITSIIYVFKGDELVVKDQNLPILLKPAVLIPIGCIFGFALLAVLLAGQKYKRKYYLLSIFFRFVILGAFMANVAGGSSIILFVVGVIAYLVIGKLTEWRDAGGVYHNIFTD